MTGSTETLLAHNLPDMADAITMPVCMMAMLFLYDWRYGIACLIPVVLSFAVMMRMAGPAMQENMRQYDPAVSRYEATQAEREKVAADIRQRGIRRREFDRFAAEPEKLPDAVLEFDDALWGSLVDYVTVSKDKTMEFALIGGTEMKA